MKLGSDVPAHVSMAGVHRVASLVKRWILGVEVTKWQAPTVRGPFAGTFKKKLGLNITSTKDVGVQRVYRITG